MKKRSRFPPYLRMEGPDFGLPWIAGGSAEHLADSPEEVRLPDRTHPCARLKAEPEPLIYFFISTILPAR